MMTDVVGENAAASAAETNHDSNDGAQIVEPSNRPTTPVTAAPTGANPLSKNQQKKLKRKQDWEDGREARKALRREKTKQRKQRRRDTRDQGHPAADSSILSKPKHPLQHSVTVPLTIIYDCGFDHLMNESELISLGSQITRAYSDNRKAKYRAQIIVSSFGGRLKERFEGLLNSNHENWKGMRFVEEGWDVSAENSKGWMNEGGKGWAPAWERIKTRITEPAHVLGGASGDEIKEINGSANNAEPAEPGVDNKAMKADQESDPPHNEDVSTQTEVVYLTSDSPHTLESLKPHSTYVIGGIVDKNRHKGLCYKRACDAGVKTAKLPIGDYLKMSSRAVLTTNQVGEIMLKWLECKDWGKAFVKVIPERKGAILKNQDGAHDVDFKSSDESVSAVNRIDNDDEIIELDVVAEKGEKDSYQEET